MDTSSSCRRCGDRSGLCCCPDDLYEGPDRLRVRRQAETDAIYAQSGTMTSNEIRFKRFAPDEDLDHVYEDVTPERRRQVFAYLATLALLALRGKVRVGMPAPIRVAGGGSHFVDLMPLSDNEHKILVAMKFKLDAFACDPQQAAEAVMVALVELAEGK